MTVQSYCFKYFQRSAIIHELLLVSLLTLHSQLASFLQILYTLLKITRLQGKCMIILGLGVKKQNNV